MNEFAHTTADISIPLVVDLDGTLLYSDMLVESFCGLLAEHPLRAVHIFGRYGRNRPAFKAALAREVSIDVTHLPYNRELIEWLRDEKARGRRIYLASASDQRYVEDVAAHLALFDAVFSSNGVINLSAENKANALSEAFGEKQFDYVGNETKDIAVWRKARKSYVVCANAKKITSFREQIAGLEIAPGGKRVKLRNYLKAMRIHQWLKNMLIFVPLLAAHRFDIGLAKGLLPFLIFGLCASSVYLLNDLIDLPNDRLHPVKHFRPLAHGTVPLKQGALLCGGLLCLAMLLSLSQPLLFFMTITAYYTLTLSYSLYLKRKMMVDVLTLAALYGIRIIAGSAATGIMLSPWLMAFSVFFFFSLALVKRCAELADAAHSSRAEPKNRDYQISDLPMLEMMAVSSGFLAVLVFDLYINSPAVLSLYRHPEVLWLDSFIMLAWFARIFLLTHRGRMHSDPVLFAVTDRVSLGSLALAALCFVGGM